MSALRACIYDGEDRPVLIIEGPPRQINAQLAADPGRTWRVIPDAMIDLADIPPPAQFSRPAHLPPGRR